MCDIRSVGISMFQEEVTEGEGTVSHVVYSHVVYSHMINITCYTHVVNC